MDSVTKNNATGETPSSDYWFIHGKAYDLTNFIAKHPGGRQVLLDTRGKNVTEMFESVHALSKVNIMKMAQEYEVPNVPVVPCPFSFSEDGTYAEIKRGVRAYFDALSSSSSNYKATFTYWMQLVCMVILHVFGLYSAIVKGSKVAAFLTGAWWMILMFYGVVHDASHFALSKKEFVNKWFTIFSCHWGLWHANIWFQHHCYGHHSFTGVASQDPDLRNGSKLLRKHPHFPRKQIHGYQHLFMFVLYFLLPNQYIGQVIEYYKARRRGRIFGLQLVDYNSTKTVAEYVVSYAAEASSIFVHFILPFVFQPALTAVSIVWLYWAGVGACYYGIVAPNHDTEGTHKDDAVDDAAAAGEGTTDKVDWGTQQILHSSNFSHSNPILTSLFGGMNYQIEHHLFPTVCNVHYPAIAHIVQEVCSRRKIQYNKYSSLLSAHWSVVKNYYALGRSSHVKAS